MKKDSVEFRYVPLYITDQVVFRCFFYENFTLFHSKFHICRRLTDFSLEQQKTSGIYLDIAAFQDFKVFLLLSHAFEDLATEKLKNIILQV